MLKLIFCIIFFTINIANCEEKISSDISIPEIIKPETINNLKYPRYQLEIIVFSNLNKNLIADQNKDKDKDKDKNKEFFPSNPGNINKKGSVEFNTVNSKNQLLLNEYNILKKNSNYKIILYNATQYNLLPSQKNKKFLIKSDELNENENENNNKNEEQNFIGTLTVTPIRNTFNLAIDGIFSKFRLTKSAKIKPKEIYYFDHPMFGALVTIKEV